MGCQPYEGNISFARAINSVCYARSHTPAAQRFPTGGVLYRGGGMDDKHRGFFVEGKKYRVPGFLATSFSEAVAVQLCDEAVVPDGGSRVLWVIHVDPAGEDSPEKRCKHAHLIQSHIPGEVEYLFTAFSTFTVRTVRWAAASGAPSRVELDAAMDNKLEPEDLPLAPWY